MKKKIESMISDGLFDDNCLILMDATLAIDREKTTNGETTNKSGDPIYQAIWADTVDFDEVLISPVMVQDHMPDTVLRALNKVKTIRRCHFSLIYPFFFSSMSISFSFFDCNFFFFFFFYLVLRSSLHDLVSVSDGRWRC